MKFYTPLYKTFFIAGILALFLTASAQTDTAAGTVTVQSSKKTMEVHSIIKDSMRYLAVRDLAALLTVNYYENPVLKKIELKLTDAGLKFTADNPYVVHTIIKSRLYDVYQFYRPVIIVQGLYYAPANELIDLLKVLSDPMIAIRDTTGPVVAAASTVPTVEGFELEQKKNGSMLRIKMSAQTHDVKQSLQIGEWLYVTMPNVQGDSAKLDTTFASGIVKRIRPLQTPTALQLSLQIRGKVDKSEVVQDRSTNDVILTLIPPNEPAIAPVNEDSIRKAEEIASAKAKIASDIQKQKKKWKLDVVVLDPGHGGHDPGAIGTIGTREKDITLGIALKLGAMIEKQMPGVKVVYTRKTDHFVELYRRGQIANENEGKLFISIHCNSTEKKPSRASGFEIYLLRPGKTEDAIQVAEKENEVVKLEKDYQDRYQNLTQENFIILTMAQSAYVKQSEQFAELLEETMSAQMNEQHHPVRQAGFYVLVGASMPNVLIETGYLSNPREERFLRSPTGQKKIADAILEALKAFKKEYEQNNK